MRESATVALHDAIENKIYLLRGKKVMLDNDLARLYGVETRVLNQAVRRNSNRFPDDFMFELTKTERANLMSQSVISSWGGIRKLPLAFTEQGVAMLSSVLKSEQAIHVNIQIMRTFTRLRQLLSSHADLKRKIEELETKYDQRFQIVFHAIKQLLEPSPKPPRKIGFSTEKI